METPKVGEKIKVKRKNGTRLRGVVVGWSSDTARSFGMEQAGVNPGERLVTLTIVLEPGQ